MRYRLILVTPDGPPIAGATVYKERELGLAIEDGDHWLSYYPEDIIMLEELPE